MHFALNCLYKPGVLRKRLALRDKHKAHVALLADRLTVEVPISADYGDTIGTLMIADFDSRSAVDAWLSGDPLTQQGVYDSVSIRPFNNVRRERTGTPDRAKPMLDESLLDSVNE